MLTKTTYSMINSAPISVLDFGADNTGVADSTSAFADAVAYVASNPNCELYFPEGTYKYSVCPNLAITNATYVAQGNVVLNYTGTGNCIVLDAGASALVFNVRMLGNFLVKGTASAKNGIYLRSVHHSKIEARILGCGTTYAGLRTEFSVVSEFNVVVSANEFGGFGSAKPANGYYLSSRSGAGEQTSACTFYNPVIEGVSGDGIYLDSAIKNQFIGGTSEGNTGFGVYSKAPNTKNNTFYGIDLEVNAAGDISEYGARNNYIDCLSDSTVIIQSGASNIQLTGGIYTNIVNNGSVSLNGINYQGSITNSSGTNISKRSVRNISGASFDLDVSVKSYSSTTSVPNSVATTVLSLPTTGNNFYRIYAHIPGLGSAVNYGAFALVYQDGATSTVLQSANGARVVISLSGNQVQVTQTAGSTQNVVCNAINP